MDAFQAICKECNGTGKVAGSGGMKKQCLGCAGLGSKQKERDYEDAIADHNKKDDHIVVGETSTIKASELFKEMTRNKPGRPKKAL